MKIRSFQPGGIIYTPFIPNQGQEQQASQESSGDSGKSKKTAVKDSVLSLLKDNGLPNDVTYALKEVDLLLSKYSGLGDRVDYDVHDLTRIADLVNQVKFNKGEYDKAATKLTSEDAWSDIAIDSGGNMYAVDKENEKGGITMITPTEYHKNKDKYQLITYGQLMRFRQTSPNSVYNSSILNDGSNAVGMTNLTKHLTDTVKQFGHHEEENYSAETFKAIENGISIMKGGMFKITSKAQIRNNDELMAACAYLFSSLSSSEQNKLIAENTARGGDPSSLKDVYSYIAQLVILTNDTTNKRDYSESFSTATFGANGHGGGSDKESSATVEMTYTEKLATGVGVRDLGEKYEITPAGSRAHLKASGKTYGPVKSSDGKGLGFVSFDEVIRNGEGISDLMLQKEIFFGDILVDNKDANALMYDGSALVRAELPWKYDAKGRVVVDFKAQKAAEEFEQWLQNHKGMRDADIQEYLQKNIPGAVWDAERKRLRFLQSKPFMVISAIASSEYLSQLGLENSSYLEHLDKEEGSQILQRYQTVLSYGTDNPGKNPAEKVHNPKDWGIFHWRLRPSSFYRGNVFIPINENLVANKELLRKSDYLYAAEETDYKAERERTITNFTEE